MSAQCMISGNGYGIAFDATPNWSAFDMLRDAAGDELACYGWRLGQRAGAGMLAKLQDQPIMMRDLARAHIDVGLQKLLRAR